MLLRMAVPDDAPVIARILVDSWRSAYRGLAPDDHLAKMDYVRGAERFREQITSGDELIYVAEEAGEIGRMAGFLALGSPRGPELDPTSTGEIYAMYLLPKHWRRGIGRSLCGEADRIFKSRACSQVVLWVFEGNERARKFYEAVGFAADGASKALNLGNILNAVRYRKTISAADDRSEQ
jgi:ribosomal protein S18 acetylase RimI-like enzyme